MSLISQNSRALINIIGIPTIIISIYFDTVFPFLIGVIIYFCSVEYANLANALGCRVSRYFLLFSNFLIFINCIYFSIDFLSILTGLFILFFSYEIFFSTKPNPINCSYYFIGVFWIGYALAVSLYQIRNLEHGLFFTLMLFIGLWVCDTSAYAFGSKFGNRKILKSISPNKTYVGSFAGLVGSIVVVYIFLNYINSSGLKFSTIDLCFISIIIGIVGQIGDFSESLFKRKADIKDTSKVLMGHGGFLDRFDSMSFSAPLLYLYIEYLII